MPLYVPASTAVARSASFWIPEDYGFKAWSYDPMLINGYNALTSNTAQMSLVHLATAQTISNFVYFLQGASVGINSNSKLGLFTVAGVQVGISAPMDTAWNTPTDSLTAASSAALVTPYAAPAGDYYVVFLSNGSSSTPSFRGWSGTTGAIVNTSLSATARRWATANTSNTSMPANMSSFGTFNASASTPWAALS